MDVKRTNTATLPRPTVTKAAPAKPDEAPRRFDDAFSRIQEGTTKVQWDAAPAPSLDLELVADLTNRRVSATTERRKTATKTRQILDAQDREIANTAEVAREEAGRIAGELDRRSAHAAALARAELDATIAVENGVTPLASKVVKLPSTAPVRVVARPGARMGPAGGQMELRLKSLLG